MHRMASVAASPWTRPMVRDREWSMRFACLLPIALMLSLAAPFGSTKAAPVLAPGQMAAEQCIEFRRTGDAEFILYNGCDDAVNLALCVEERVGTGCGRPEDFVTHRAAAGADYPGVYRSLQLLNMFACRSPTVVLFAAGGQARCERAEALLPLLLASSLKNPGTIITAADYPRNVSAEGTTRFEMLVAADGRPTSCNVTVSSGTAALDTATCNAFMRRARFSPAKNASGQPVEGRYRGSVTWKKP
ncbi:MAG: hypothetical protein RIS11_274 [Pseudomonadota bacterium]